VTNGPVEVSSTTTHLDDVELLDLLDASFAAHHFREQIIDETLSFDYRMQPGPSSTRNALALLEYMKYPPEIVADAIATLDWQRGRLEGIGPGAGRAGHR
jgi:DNA mismatch repair ATPase MutS